MKYQSNPCAPMMPHAQSLQVQLPDGTISGKIKQKLPPIINTKIGLQQLARYIHYSDEQMINIDWPNYHISSKSSTSTALSRAHACKAFNNQWYTDALAHKYNSDLSPTCRCCQSNRNETIAHIIGCPSRAQTHDEFHPQVTAHFQACRIGDHLLSALELGIEIVLSDTDSHRGETWRGNVEGSDVEQRVASFLDGNTVSRHKSKENAWDKFLYLSSLVALAGSCLELLKYFYDQRQQRRTDKPHASNEIMSKAELSIMSPNELLSIVGMMNLDVCKAIDILPEKTNFIDLAFHSICVKDNDK